MSWHKGMLLQSVLAKHLYQCKAYHVQHFFWLDTQACQHYSRKWYTKSLFHNASLQTLWPAQLRMIHDTSLSFAEAQSQCQAGL